MKPRSVFFRAVAFASLLVASFTVGCGSDGPSTPDPDAEVIGILEQVIRIEGANHFVLVIHSLGMDDYPNCEWWCDSEFWLSLEHLAWPILVIEPDGSTHWGGVNDMAIGDTIRARLWPEWHRYYYAKKIWVIKPVSSP